MIKASELRLGNLIQTNYEGILTIRQISQELILCAKSNHLPSGSFDITAIKPIPLTEEWLLRLGAKTYREHCEISPLKWTMLYECPIGFPAFVLHSRHLHFIEGKWIDYASRTDVSFVHTLQNLIFALTGEELTIKEANNETKR